MKTTCKFERALKSDKGVFEVTFSIGDINIINRLKELQNDTLSLEIAKKHNKRSLNANAYYWVLADEIAKAISVSESRPYTARDVYKEHIMDIGAFYMIPVKQSEVDKFIEIWEGKGIGWICEDYRESNLEGYEVMKCYYGSSDYDTTQMNRLIELAIADAKELGIETITPNEVAELIAFWGNKLESENGKQHIRK